MARSYKVLYDPKTGVKLLTLKEAASYLHYHPFSVYKLVSQGVLKPHKIGGKTLVFMQDELDRYKLSNKWAARKALIAHRPELTSETPSETMTATVTVDLGLGLMFSESEHVDDFSWEQIPLIRADLDQRYGGKMKTVEITVNSPDGWRWNVRLEPPTLIEKALRKLKKPFKGETKNITKKV